MTPAAAGLTDAELDALRRWILSHWNGPRRNGCPDPQSDSRSFDWEQCAARLLAEVERLRADYATLNAEMEYYSKLALGD